jgi:hypothetical protein
VFVRPSPRTTDADRTTSCVPFLSDEQSGRSRFALLFPLVLLSETSYTCTSKTSTSVHCLRRHTSDNILHSMCRHTSDSIRHICSSEGEVLSVFVRLYCKASTRVHRIRHRIQVQEYTASITGSCDTVYSCTRIQTPNSRNRFLFLILL